MRPEVGQEEVVIHGSAVVMVGFQGPGCRQLKVTEGTGTGAEPGPWR